MSDNSHLLTIPEFADALRIKPSCVRGGWPSPKSLVFTLAGLSESPRAKSNGSFRSGHGQLGILGASEARRGIYIRERTFMSEIENKLATAASLMHRALSESTGLRESERKLLCIGRWQRTPCKV